MSEEKLPAPEILGKTIVDQHRASNPTSSAWVSANAGSGKTYVLAQRVIRLLLSGVAPTKILCLTFTKAAAAQMSNRVFEKLGKWSNLDDEELRQEIINTGQPNPNPTIMRRARLLFTRAMESPGGLKVQTIHAFCEALLHQFTLEANTSGHFEVIGDYEQITLLEEARQSMLAETLQDPQLAAALRAAMDYGSDLAIEKGLSALIGERQDFSKWININHDGLDEAVNTLGNILAVDINETSLQFATRQLAKFPIDDLKFKELGIAASHYDKAENKRVAKLIDAYCNAKDDIEKLHYRIELYSTKSGSIKKDIGIKTYREAIAGLHELFELEKEIIRQIKDEIKTRDMLLGSHGLFKLAECCLRNYSNAKRARGLLDYDDLINRTADLLARSDVRQWVQYKLDAGIDHVLVDEAQDTSPAQWEIINAIIEEYFAGQSVQHSGRTVFAVGDPKQSIFSFQGAEPDMFSRQKTNISELAKGAQLEFADVKLDISFRSTRDVLSAVDAVFRNPQNADGLQSLDAPIVHEPVRQSDPGEVLIWPMIENPKKQKQEDWRLPVDHVSEEHPTVQLAKRITQTIKQWIDEGEELPGQGRNISSGDILILVRNRIGFASAVTRELKQAGLSVAGADRLNLTTHIAIEDMLSLAKWTLFPEDDLSLAEVLKSPLFDFDEEVLAALCIDRGQATLWQNLCAEKLNDEAGLISKTESTLNHLLHSAATLAPFEFYTEILSVLQGRKKYKARLGDEVDDVLDAFLLEALNHTNNGGSGLQEFIHALQEASPEIKRELDLQRDEIRVMTVHSAKGLEAPIVFLVDPGSSPYSSHHRPSIIKDGDDNRPSLFLWQPDKKKQTNYTDLIYQNIIDKSEQEYRRLLYVGMTRAEDKLIVCGYANRNTGAHQTWHKMVHQALGEDCQEVGPDGILRWTTPHQLRKPRKLETPKSPTTDTYSTLPPWVSIRPDFEPKDLPPLSPSIAAAHLENPPRRQDALGAQNNAPDNFALQRGNATHHLLQLLPQVESDKHSIFAANYLAKSFADWSDAQRQKCIDEVLKVINDPRFSHVFTNKSMPELSISGVLDPDGLNRTISGQIDRVCVTNDSILVVDYKTDRQPPESVDKITSQYVVQLAIYRNLVRDIYPHKNIHCALLWTSTPLMMEIPDEILSHHLQIWLEQNKLTKQGHRVA